MDIKRTLIIYVVITRAVCLPIKPWHLRVINSNNTSLVNKTIQLQPSAHSAPIQNLNKKIFGIVAADPIHACQNLQDPHLVEIEMYPVLIVIDAQEGACGVTRKIFMAKQTGVKGIVFVGPNTGMDGYGGFQDRTFLVFNVLKSDPNYKILIENPYLISEISTPSNGQTTPILQLWLSSLDTKSYSLLRMWQESLKQIPQLGHRVIWRPRYALWGCNSAHISDTQCNSAQYQSNCACAGQICSPQLRFQVGDAAIKEDARQKFIYNQFYSRYFAYLSAFRDHCLKIFQTENFVQDCALSQMVAVGLPDEQIQDDLQKVTETCSGSTFNELVDDRNRFNQLGIYPSAVLNLQPINFSTKKQLQLELCRKLKLEKQEGCVRITRMNTIASFTINVLFFVLIIGGILGILAGIILLYRRSIQKQMRKQMRMQVQASVEHYFALTQHKK